MPAPTVPTNPNLTELGLQYEILKQLQYLASQVGPSAPALPTSPNLTEELILYHTLLSLNYYVAQVSAGSFASGTIKMAVIAGGVAGNLTVTGIAVGDVIIGILRLDRDGAAANINFGNLTAEFTVTAPNTINNAAGTNTTGDALAVFYIDKT